MTVKLGFCQNLDTVIANLIFLGIFMAAPHPPAVVQENTLQIWYPVIVYHNITSDVCRASLNHLRFVGACITRTLCRVPAHRSIQA